MIKGWERQFDTEISFHFWVEQRLIKLFQYFVYIPHSAAANNINVTVMGLLL